MDDLAKLRNRWVHFRLLDVFVPPPQQVLEELHGEDILQGKVVGFTDRGNAEGIFVVVEVEGLKHAVVVPLEQIRGVI